MNEVSCEGEKEVSNQSVFYQSGNRKTPQVLELRLNGAPGTRMFNDGPLPTTDTDCVNFPLLPMFRFFDHFRMALWRAFQHDAFAVAKAAAFSAILTLFPAILVMASLLSFLHLTEALMRELSHALGRILPEGTSSAVLQYFTGNKPVRLKVPGDPDRDHPVDRVRRDDLVDAGLP